MINSGCLCKNVLYGLSFFSFLYVLGCNFFECYSCQLSCHSQNRREIICAVESVLVCHPVKNIPPVSCCKVIIKLHTGVYPERCTAFATGRCCTVIFPVTIVMQ